jgi:hypothetical protein
VGHDRERAELVPVRVPRRGRSMSVPAPFGFVISDAQYIGRHRVAVFVHHTTARMHAWCQENGIKAQGGGFEWEALTSEHRTDEWDIEVHLSTERLYLSIVAHEATHVALLLYASVFLSSQKKARAWRHVRHHTEWIPELVGNLTAHIVYGLREHGYRIDFDAEEAA